jgi:predicted O-methyltransferase YrrM
VIKQRKRLKYAVLNLPRESDAVEDYDNKFAPVFRHPAYACLGLRPALAQHTSAEHDALRRWAQGRSTLVEIGVAEGVSALALRETMSTDGTLYLIDPFHLSRFSALNFMKRAAHRAVESCPRGKVEWIEKFSYEAVRGWTTPIDLIVIDGDHSDVGVERDWNDWSRFVKPGGVVLFHDSCIFSGGWTRPDYGPVKLVNHLFRENPITGWIIREEVHSLLIVERCGSTEHELARSQIGTDERGPAR